MESDKHYFIEGLFVIVLSVAMALFFVWLAKSGDKDDVRYRIYFSESVSGLTLGDPVKYLGVDIGKVDAMSIDADNPRRVQVDVKLRKDALVKTDTKAILQTKGITGACFVELNGGSVAAPRLVDATPDGQVPVIPSEKSSLNTILEQLPKVIAKFSAIEDQAKKVVTDVSETTAKIKDNPSLLLRRPKEKKNDEGAAAPADPAGRAGKSGKDGKDGKGHQ